MKDAGKLSESSIRGLLNKIISWDVNPYVVSSKGMDRYTEDDEKMRDKAYPISYQTKVFFECVNKLQDNQLATIKDIIDQVIANTNFQRRLSYRLPGYT